jgi:hypothetical protein
MSKIKLLGLAFLSLAMITLVDCKGNKGGDNSAENDTALSLPDDGYGDLTNVDINYNGQVDSSVLNEQVLTEDQNGNLIPEETETNNDSDRFYIIAGSFQLYSNAQKQNQKLKNMGFDSKILEPYGQYNRVTVKEFATRDQARAALPGLRTQIKDQTLWLLKR